MDNSAFSFKSQVNTVIEDNGTCNITQNITQSLPHWNIFDWVSVNPLLCIQPGDILWRNPSTGNFEPASAATLAMSHAVGVVEEVGGCEVDTVKLVYQGRICFPDTYSTRNGGVYYLADTNELAEKGSDIIRNGSLTKGTNCHPTYVGTGGSKAVVINSLYCVEGDVVPPPTNPELQVGVQCFPAGPKFTVTNVGSAELTSSVLYEIVSGSTQVDAGTITNPLSVGASETFTMTESVNYTMTVGTGSIPLLYDSATSNCNFDTEFINVRLVTGAGAQPDALTWFPSDLFTPTGGTQTITWTGAVFPTINVAAINLEDYLILSPNNASVSAVFGTDSIGDVTVTYTSANGLYV